MNDTGWPLIHELTTPIPPAEVLELLGVPVYGFILESTLVDRRQGRYSFVGVDPFLVLESKGQEIVINRGDQQEKLNGNPFETLRELLKRYRVPRVRGLPPFWGGAVGYLAYDLGRQLENLPEKAIDDLGLPDCRLAFYDTVYYYDHLNEKAGIIATGLPETGARRKTRARERLAEFLASLQEKTTPIPACPTNIKSPDLELKRHFKPEEYCAAVNQAKEYIAAGDIFVINLSQRFDVKMAAQPWDVYRRLRAINPAPFAGYLAYPDAAIISASPERFLQLKGRRVVTRPIKGTRPRSNNPHQDRRNRRELWQSEKDRAELAMIVDLERNDLGRVCQVGSVKVPELYRLETYATVFHLVSTVSGRLVAGKNNVDLLAASFPGGSITGAPKIRAMQIIDELEPVRRGIYCGSIGYLSFNGDVDLNIVIRTLIYKDGHYYLQAGGGITIDSDPDLEHQETLDKARALFNALQSGDFEEVK